MCLSTCVFEHVRACVCVCVCALMAKFSNSFMQLLESHSQCRGTNIAVYCRALLAVEYIVALVSKNLISQDFIFQSLMPLAL